MQPYLTWRTLLAIGAARPLSEEQLDEPVLMTIQDGYGTMLAYPVQLLTGSAYQALCLPESDEALEYELRVNGSAEDLDGSGLRLLRTLPPDALLLHFSEAEEDWKPRTEWLGQPNPHTPPPPPPTPGPAPLFEGQNSD